MKAARLLALALGTLTGIAHAAPVPAPVRQDSPTLLAAIPDDQRADFFAGKRVYTFAPLERSDEPKGLILESLSLVVSPKSPASFTKLLRAVESYPEWVSLSPTYKHVRVRGTDAISCETGRSSSPKAQRILPYRVSHADDVLAWTLETNGTPIKAGSSVSFEVRPGPDGQGTLLLHRQSVRLPSRGRLTKYLRSHDKKGRHRFWKDVDKHARRMHWAMVAALVHPAGTDRQALYVEHYQRDFGGVPWWAERNR
ncbi:MAG: hypothetical protein AAF533_24390 [Acidobacteriota bacterium]